MNPNNIRMPLPKPRSLPIEIILTTLLYMIFSFPSKSQQLQLQQQNYLLPGHNLENVHISESQQVGSLVHQLKAIDRNNENRKFTYHMSGDFLRVDELTGEVRLAKLLDREQRAQLTVIVSVFDQSDLRSDSPVETKRRLIYVDDVDDSWPLFNTHKSSVVSSATDEQSIANYRLEISEMLPLGSIVISDIQVSDADEAQNADLMFECRSGKSTNNACETFSIESRRIAPSRYNISIRTKLLLDYERIQNYRLALFARSKRPSPLTGMPLETEAKIEIQVINVQDEGPVFLNAPYSLSMKENLPNKTRLLNLMVQDGDLAPQRELSVIVAPSQFSEYFQIQRDTEATNLWYLETNKQIDREDPTISRMGNLFNISLLAAELDDRGRPIASDSELESAIREQSYARSSLKKENVTIVILDVLDSAPSFIQASTGKILDNVVLVLNVSESIQTGASVPNLDLAAVDFDQGVNSRFNLSLLDSDIGPPASLAFGLESEVIYGKSEIVLNVLNSSLLDYEQHLLRQYRFNLIAGKSVNAAMPLAKMIEVQINVVDANDNWPEFDKNQYILEVNEDAQPGTRVGAIQAIDRDSGPFGKLDYVLRGPGASKFKLLNNEGVILVNDCGLAQCLDYEIQQSYSLTYEARDGGKKTSNVSVIINVLDINDYQPRFTESIYKRELISDNLSNNQNYITPQLIVKARDGDGGSSGKTNNVTYSIKSSNLTGLEVHRNSGLVYLSQPIDLDSLIGSSPNGQANPRSMDNNFKGILFEAEVLAEDNGFPPLNSTAKIHLVVRGNREGAPHFKQDSYLAHVRENHPPGKTFFQVQAYDPDDKDSQLRYSIGNDLNDLLQINSQTGELSFKDQVDYDDFKGHYYNVTVYATDSTRPQPQKASTLLSLIVQDVNNKAPKFENNEYKSVLVQGKSKPGDIVIQVKATDFDSNAHLNYSIDYDRISMRDRNGFEFTIADLTNGSPAFEQMAKLDATELAKYLKKLFAINKTTGAIELLSELDYTLAASITIQLKVIDLSQEIGQPQQDFARCNFILQSHVDKNPIFAPPWTITKRDYNITIVEELSPGSVIFSLLAKDPSTNQRIESFEKIFASDPKNYFRVTRLGVIHVNNRIDYEQLAPSQRKLSISVKAISSEDYFSVANININIVDLNDNAPIFKNETYKVDVSESILYPNDIITVQAEDKDSNEFSKIHYSLASNYESKFFNIDSRKGIISLAKGAKLDRESEAMHTLLVVASDCVDLTSNHGTGNCHNTSIIVQISLIDENDNEPLFMDLNEKSEYDAVISETVASGTVICQINARDSDEGQNGQVRYEIEPNLEDHITQQITIDREGFIKVTGSLAGLGRKQEPYKIIIKASDNGKQAKHSYATLMLSVEDVIANDGLPKFIRPKLGEVVHLSEATGPGTLVYQVQAIDPEQDSKVMYKLSKPSDIFDMDPFSGNIHTQSRSNFILDREHVANYTLIIIAQDLGSPARQSHQVLIIKLTDVNDNEPFFDRGIDDPPLQLLINEEVPNDTLVGSIRAIDRDIGTNALISYEIIEGNQNNLFKLNYEIDSEHTTSGNNPCRIYTNGRLDKEARDSYTLTIKAASLARLRGNPFNPIHYQTNTYRDTLISRNSIGLYNASDLSKIRLTIKLLDINDNRPIFQENNVNNVVDSSAQIYSQLMSFKATDADSPGSDMQYSLLDVLFYSDSKYRFNEIEPIAYGVNQLSPTSARHVFDVDPRKGILRNAVSLRPYIDGYFEIFVKADSSQYNSKEDTNPVDVGKCVESGDNQTRLATASQQNRAYSNLENCYVAITKGVIFVTQQRETFRFVFNKTRLNDRFDEFKTKIQKALEELMYENPHSASSSMESSSSLSLGGGGGGGGGSSSLDIPTGIKGRSEKLLLNTFNTDFYEREDGSLDFSTLTSCSQLVKFADQSNDQLDDERQSYSSQPFTSISHGLNVNNAAQYNGISNQRLNQIVSYDQVLSLMRALNQTQHRQAQNGKSTNLLAQYGLMNIERCLPNDRTQYRLSLPEKVSLYIAIFIAIIGSLLAFIVSQVRKSYEKNLRLLQRSKYQYMSNHPGGTLAPIGRHLSLASLAGPHNYVAQHPYLSPMAAAAAAAAAAATDYEGAPLSQTWQL